MDLNAIKAKLDALNSNGQEREKTDYTKIFWKPELGKQTVRLLPSFFDPAMPFKEMKFHYGVGERPMVALSNFGKQDPIEEFVNELKKTSDRDNWSLAGKLNPKTRVFAPVIVRGQEDQGVRLWGFGVTIQKALYSLIADEDIGDITDVINGWDLVVEQVQGNPYPQTTVRIKPKQTALSDNNTLVEAWLKEQPDPMEVHKPMAYDFVKKQLQKYLDPSAEIESDAPAATPGVVTAPTTTDFSLETAQSQGSTKAEKFTDLFNE